MKLKVWINLLDVLNLSSGGIDVSYLFVLKLGDALFTNINKNIFGKKKKVIYATGNNFVKSKIELDCDVVNIEAHGIGKDCKIKSIAFEYYKYIVDYANGDSNKNWNNNTVKEINFFFKKLLESSL